MSLFGETQEQLLFLVWDDAYSPNAEASVHAIGPYVPPDKSELVAKKAVDALVERGLMEWVDTRADGRFEITAKGLEYVEAQLEFEDSDIAQFAAHLDAWGRANKEADNEWQPLPIDRSAPEYIEAVAELEGVVGVIEGDNGYAANEPDERNSIVWSLKQGLAAIKGRISYKSANVCAR